MNQPKTSRIPAPIYAAAGAGELAIQQLRRLPTIVHGLGGRVVVTGGELRQRATESFRTANLAATEFREKAVSADLDLVKLREVAVRNAAAVLAGAQAAQQRASTVYGALVARGERVVGAGVIEAAETVNADMEATHATTVTADPAGRPDSPSGAGAGVEPAAPAQVAEPATPARAAEPATPAQVAEAAEAKPAAATRARTAKATSTPSAKLPKSSARRPDSSSAS